MTKVKIIMRITPESCIIAYFERKGVIDNHVFKPQADKERDRYSSNKLSDGLGAGIRPISQPSKRKVGSRQGKGNWRASGHKFEPKHRFNCKHCGKAGMGKLKTRDFCYNNGLCKGRYETARKKAGK